MQFPEKVMNQTWKNDKKTNFGPDVGSFWPNFGLKKFFSKILFLLDVRNFCNPSLYLILRKTNQPNLRKWQKKPLVLGPFLTPLTQIRVPNIFVVDFASTQCYALLQAIIVWNFKYN